MSILLAVIFGICAGIEREIRGKPAGVKTHAIVCLSCCLLSMLAIDMFGQTDSAARIMANILTGIGFIGAGVIFRQSNSHPTGITTAAEIWYIAVVGILCGVKYFGYAFIATISILLLQVSLGVIERRFYKNGRE